jgi:hypothetical protein
MIIFELACAQGHRFEGWFASSDEFARQRERALVTCPMCNDAHVERIPSARVSVPKGSSASREAPPPKPEAGTPPAAPQAAVAGLPPELVARLRDIVKDTENVGARFPEEARKIHYEETPPRAIRGQASPDEAKALSEEGIEFASLPPFLLPDQH